MRLSMPVAGQNEPAVRRYIQDRENAEGGCATSNQMTRMDLLFGFISAMNKLQIDGRCWQRCHTNKVSFRFFIQG
ncbi:MAG: hypothetical protein ACREDQ_02135 [Limisphaerales bacterium]